MACRPVTINQLINYNLTQRRSLNDIKCILESTLERPLSERDSFYVEYTYVELLVSKWLEQAPEEIVKSIKPDQMLDFVQELGSIKTFCGCSKFSTNFDLSNLVLRLYDESPRLRAIEEKTVLQFKQRCLYLVQLHIGQIQQYSFTFHNEFVNVLKNSSDLQQIFNLLKVQEFVSGTITFKDLLTHLLEIKLSDNNIRKLQQAGKQCSDKDYFSLEKNLKEVIEKFLEPVVVKQLTVDGRKVLEVAGPHIVMSRVTKMEFKNTNFEQIDEFRFIKALVIHADINLDSSDWRGKNLVISTQTLIVNNEGILWDVSGANAEEAPSLGDDAADRYGQVGADGLPGEPGGNVWVMVESLEGGDLIIISNGGNGSKGLDGTMGENGKDGQYVKDFKTKFPPVSNFFDSSKVKNLKENKMNIFSCLKSVQIFYYNETTLKDVDSGSLCYWFSKEDLEDFYIKGETTDGCEITFSFYSGAFLSKCQSHLLYKGAPGEQGKPGGVGGSGGSAGLAGDIEVYVGHTNSSANVKCVRNNGKPGTDGKCGSHGNSGISGADCGYMDKTLSTYWPIMFVTHPKDDKRLTIEHSDSSSSVWCPYQKQYVEIKETKQRLWHTSQQYKLNNAFVQKKKLTGQSMRKKTINFNDMVAKYRTDAFTGFDQLNDSMEMVKRSVDQLINTYLESDQVTTEFTIKKQISYFHNSHKMNIIPEYNTLDELDVNPNNENKNKYLGTTYKLQVLKNISNHYLKKECIKTEFKVDFKFLQLIGKGCNQILTISEQPDELLSKYFCLNNNESIEELYKLLDSSDEVYLNAIIVFIKSFGSLEVKSRAAEYLNRYNNLKKCGGNKSKAKLTPILRCFEQPESSKLYTELCDSILAEDQRSLINVLSDMKNDAFLNKLYGHYQHAREAYNWRIACNDEKLREEIKREINKGPFTEFYRELLSYQVKRNIICFIAEKNENILLLSNHNPREENKIYVLLKDDKFYKLNVNVELAQLLYCHKENGSFYSNIMFHIDSLIDKIDIDKFSAEVLSDCKIYEGIDKGTSICVEMKHIINQDSEIEQIKSIFYSSKDDIVCPRLEKLKVEYIGYTNILHYMSLHFEKDGKTISSKEFCYVLNFILGSALTIPTSIPLISWIIASFSPVDWLIEITILKLEFFLGTRIDIKTKSRWRSFINDQNEKPKLMAIYEKICEKNNNIGIDLIDEVLFLMSCIPKAHDGLEHIDVRDWKYYLKDKYWQYKLKSNTNWHDDIVKLSSLYFALLDNSKGFDKANKLLDILIKQSNEVPNELEPNTCNVIKILRCLSNKDVCLDDTFIETLSTVNIHDWLCRIEQVCFDSRDERSLPQVVELIEKCNNTSSHIRSSLRSIESSVEISEMYEQKLSTEILVTYKLEEWVICLLQLIHGSTNNSGRKMEKNEQSDIRKVLNETFGINLINGLYDLLLATISISIHEKLQIKLRNTQKLSINMFLKSERNVLAQISTGEGKSLIIVCVSIIKAISGQKVDIITSSNVLAKRDAKEYEKVYNIFGLNVGHNCSEKLEDRKKVYSSCHIVYGELSNFQRDFLLDRMYDKNVLGDRKFETILVDEVDSLLLDRGNNTLYLSHEIPGLDKLEPLFVYIWKWLNTPTDKSDLELKENILINLGQVNKHCLRELDSSLSETEIKNIWEVLMNEGIIQQNGIIIKDDIDYDKLDVKTKNYIHINHLKYMCDKVINIEKQFVIPNYLKSFVYRHLGSWIESAQMAMSMVNGSHYIVDIDRSDTNSYRSPNITILDKDTGTDQTGSQWENGLHQFLQLKHGCKTFSISLKAVFISNVSFIKKYRSLYGLSGTLGTSMERNLLIDVYDVEYITIPTAKAKLFFEMLPITCKNQDDWTNKIFNSVYEISKTRSALIICESVNDVMSLNYHFDKYLKEMKAPPHIKVHTYKRDYEQLHIADSLKPGQIIISTNLAGRGTDIKLSQELINADGLHVCLSFLPANIRVEEQAFGRVARNGQPGTAQIVFMSEYENSISKVVDLKQARNVDEIQRITSIKSIYESQIVAEEKHFEAFQQKFSELRDMKYEPENVKSLLLQICLDKWAYWLDKNFDNIKNVSNEEFINDISKLFETDFKKGCNCIKDPFQLTKLGFIYLQEGNYEISKCLFNKVLIEEKNFSETALYYRIYTKGPQPEISGLLDDFTMVETTLKKLMSTSLMMGNFVDILKSYDLNSIIQVNCFKQQQTQRYDIYNIFLQSVYDIMGHEIWPHDLVLRLDSLGDDKNNDFISHRIYNKCIENEIIKLPQLKQLKENDLMFVLQYGIHPKEIHALLREYKSVIGSIYIKNNGLKKIKDGSELMKQLKQLLPSRELFWHELLEKKILLGEVTYLFIDFRRLEKETPYLMNVIRQFIVDVPIDKNFIWLYQNNEIKIMNSDCNYWVIEKFKVKYVIGEEIYSYLKHKAIIYSNKVASISSSHCWKIPLMFKYFDSLVQSDFNKFGMNDDVSKTIIAELEAMNIIKRCSHNSQQFSLISNEDEIEKIQLSRHPAYTSDVKSLLAHNFSFHFAYLKLAYLISECRLDGEKVCLPIQPYLHKSFLEELEDNILTGPKVQTVQENLKNTIYPQTMDTKKWIIVFSPFIGKFYADAIVKSLIKCKWLLNKNSQYYINYCRSDEDRSKSINTYILIQPEKLPHYLEEYKDLIEFVLMDYLALNEHVNVIEEKLRNCIGHMYYKKKPIFDFKPLLSVLKDEDKLTSEYNIFNLNGFDQVMIVKEKPFSFTTFLQNVILVPLLEMSQIAVGFALLFHFPHVMPIVDSFRSFKFSIDLILDGFRKFFTRCLHTCNYTVSKMKRLTFSAVSYVNKFGIFRSVFGSFTAENSLKYIINNNQSKSVFNIKGMFKNIKGLFVSETVKTGIMDVIVSKVVNTSSLAFDVRNKNELVHQIITGQLEKLTEDIINIIDANIYKTIVDHEVIQILKKSCNSFSEEKFKEICRQCFKNVIDEKKNQSNKKFVVVSNSCKTVMDKCLTDLSNNIKQEDSNEVNSTNIAKIFSNFIKMTSSCCTCWSQITTVVSDILNTFQGHLDQKFTENLNQHAPIVNDNTYSRCNDFINASMEQWKSEIKQLLFNNINEHILVPLLKHTFNKLQLALMDDSFKNCSFFSDKEIQDFSKSKPKQKFKRESYDDRASEGQKFVDIEYNQLLLALLKTERHTSVFAEISKRNFPVDTNCIEMCCELVPKILRKECVMVPPIEIVLDIDGVEKTFKLAPIGSNFTTLYLAPNESIFSNSSNHSLCVKTFIHTIAKTICPKEFHPHLSSLLNRILGEIESNGSTLNLYYTRQLACNKPPESYIEYINKKIECRLAYQHKRWRFNPSVDIDLREDGLSHSSPVDYILKGFEAALTKINQYILTVLQPIAKVPFKLNLKDFNVSDYEIWPQSEQSADFPFQCQPACYKLLLPMPFDTSLKFLITMRLKSRVDKKAASGPRGAHILYEIRPLVSITPLDTMCGYILLDEKCERVSHTVDQCHVAGDLIIPSGFIYRQDCDALIIGDTQFKNNVGECIVNLCQFEMKVVEYKKKKIIEIKDEIINACKMYRGTRCVVLYIGTESIDLTDSGETIAQTIAEIMLNLQSCFGTANIILCSLQDLKRINCPELLKKTDCINQYLLSFCGIMNLTFVDLKICKKYMTKLTHRLINIIHSKLNESQ